MTGPAESFAYTPAIEAAACADVLNVSELGVRFKGRGGFLANFGRSGRASGDVWALQSVSLTLGRGDTLSVVGESGSGKTTLLRALLGLVPPTSGCVELWGRSVGAMRGGERTAARRRCGYILQDPYSSLPPTMTVLGAVLEPWSVVHGARGRGEGLERAKALLGELKLPEELWGARARYSLSGGQRQRVAVARALILGPELLLCDEPTAMQDVSTRGEVLDVLTRRISGGMSMILVTHDLMLARRAASRALVLYRGEAVEAGDTEDMLRCPEHPYTRALLEAIPRL